MNQKSESGLKICKGNKIRAQKIEIFQLKDDVRKNVEKCQPLHCLVKKKADNEIED